MTRHDAIVRVQHMIDHARETVQIASSHTRSDLDNDRLFNLAIMRLMEVIGEAASRIPDTFREKYDEIPWRDITDLRNRLIHGYDDINYDVLWKIITEDLPPLIHRLEKIVVEES